MATPEEFEQQMVTFGVTARNRAVKAVRDAFVGMAQDIITETPADVGTAKSNWIASRDGPAEGTIPAYVPGKKGSTASENAAEAIARAVEIAAAYDSPRGSLHLTNNLRYIGYLNGGSPTTPPRLFVERALARGAETANRVRLLD